MRLPTIVLAVLSLTLLVPACKKKDTAPGKEAAKKARTTAGMKTATEAGTTPKRPPRKPRWGAYACQLVKPCYRKYKAFGSIQGQLLIRVDAQGKALRASYRRGKVPAPVRKCLLDSAKALRIPGFTGKPGFLKCGWSGNLMAGGIEMMSWSDGYMPVRRRRPKGDAAKTPINADKAAAPKK